MGGSSRPVLGPFQPPMQWVTGALPMVVKRSGSEADHSPPCSTDVKNAWSYTCSPPIRLSVVALKQIRLAWLSVKHRDFTFILQYVRYLPF